jgi:hypothetical protein
MILAKRKPRSSFRLCALMFVALASYIHCAIEFHDHPDQFQDEPLIHDDSDTYAAVVWFEDQCMWIASRFWSNLLTVLIGGHVTLFVLWWIRRSYIKSYERRWGIGK